MHPCWWLQIAASNAGDGVLISHQVSETCFLISSSKCQVRNALAEQTDAGTNSPGLAQQPTRVGLGRITFFLTPLPLADVGRDKVVNHTNHFAALYSLLAYTALHTVCCSLKILHFFVSFCHFIGFKPERKTMDWRYFPLLPLISQTENTTERFLLTP